MSIIKHKTRGFVGGNKNKHFVRNEKLDLIMSMDGRTPRDNVFLPEIAINFKSPEISINQSAQSTTNRISMNFKTNLGSPINILNQSYMGKTRFVNNSSRSPSPLEDISLCKAMTLENALNSRKLGTTKYLHAYNLTSSRISRKGSRATDIYPAMEEQPMILALHHE